MEDPRGERLAGQRSIKQEAQPQERAEVVTVHQGQQSTLVTAIARQQVNDGPQLLADENVGIRDLGQVVHLERQFNGPAPGEQHRKANDEHGPKRG